MRHGRKARYFASASVCIFNRRLHHVDEGSGDSLFKGSSSLQRGYIDALLCSLFTELYKLLSILEVLLASNSNTVKSH